MGKLSERRVKLGEFTCFRCQTVTQWSFDRIKWRFIAGLRKNNCYLFKNPVQFIFIWFYTLSLCIKQLFYVSSFFALLVCLACEWQLLFVSHQTGENSCYFVPILEYIEYYILYTLKLKLIVRFIHNFIQGNENSSKFFHFEGCNVLHLWQIRKYK